MKTGDYSKGKIYKLVSDQTDEIYIGSTSEHYLSRRLIKHRYDFRRWYETRPDYITSFKLLKYEDCKIILIENYPCNDKYELEARERYHIENNVCVNKQFPGRTSREYYEANQEYIKSRVREYTHNHKEEISVKQKEYREKNREERLMKKKECYQKNKEIINQKNKEKYETNKDMILARNKIYRDNNKESKAIHDKQYYEANKQRISERGKEHVICELCGIELCKSSLSNHKRSIKCKNTLDLTPSTSASSNK